MEGFVILLILGGIVWAAIAASNATAKRLQDAKAAYDSSLAALKRNPTDPDLKQRTLALGREYSNLTRQQKGVTVYDEVALSNDIGAACAAATRGASGSSVPQESAESRLSKLGDLHRRGFVNDQEYQAQRERILKDL